MFLFILNWFLWFINMCKIYVMALILKSLETHTPPLVQWNKGFAFCPMLLLPMLIPAVDLKTNLHFCYAQSWVHEEPVLQSGGISCVSSPDFGQSEMPWKDPKWKNKVSLNYSHWIMNIWLLNGLGWNFEAGAAVKRWVKKIPMAKQTTGAAWWVAPVGLWGNTIRSGNRGCKPNSQLVLALVPR